MQGREYSADRHLKRFGLGAVKVHEDLRRIGRIGGENPHQCRVLVGGYDHGPGRSGNFLGALVPQGLQPEVKPAGHAEALDGRWDKSKTVGRGDGSQFPLGLSYYGIQLQARTGALIPGVQYPNTKSDIFSRPAEQTEPAHSNDILDTLNAFEFFGDLLHNLSGAVQRGGLGELNIK